MINIDNNIEYKKIIVNIINNKEFRGLSNIYHHGSNRYLHSIRVSYLSYLISKFLRLDYKSVAIGGLLHDFFYTDTKGKMKVKVRSLFKHSKTSLVNSNKIMVLNNKEENIIFSHMFPINILRVPKYLESWIVNLVDKYVAFLEFMGNYRYLCNLRIRNALVILTLFFTRAL